MKPRLHLVALPHVRLGTPTTHLCAYSTKTRLFCKMMESRYDAVVYAPESDPVPGAHELVNCLPESERVRIFGADDRNNLPNWPNDEQTRQFNLRVMAELHARAGEKEIILLSGGETHRAIEKEFPGRTIAECFVGYEGVLRGRVHAAYESYAHMSQVAQKYAIHDIRWFDRVIPPFVDPAEFPHLNDGKGDYLLFVGRLIERKGLHIAAQIAKACNMRLVVAGSGGKIMAEGILHAGDAKWYLSGQGTKIELQNSADYKGPVGIEDRSALMAGAKAFICPTMYLEPGGNVAIEAQFAGTPVICPDWGVFAETVQHGLTGFHFRTLKQAVEAVNKCETLTPGLIRHRANSRYSLEVIGDKFDEWFKALDTLWLDGWNTL